MTIKLGTLCVAIGLPLGAATAACQGASSQNTGGPLRIYPPADSLRADPNGFLFNPSWLGNSESTPPNIEVRCNFRAGTGHLERRVLFRTHTDCLSDEERHLLTINETSAALNFGVACASSAKTGKIRGHVNWFPITATGQLVWHSYLKGFTDHDVNIDFATPLPNAATATNSPLKRHGDKRGYHLEFYDWETLQRLRDPGSSFWHRLRIAMHHKKTARDLVDDRFAIVTGLYGVDAVHRFHAELHPVFAMAVLVDSATIPGRTTFREQWAIMLRNLGTEGDCAQGTLPLLIPAAPGATLQDFIFDLGSWHNAGPATLRLGPSWSSHPGFLPTGFLTRDSSDRFDHVYLKFTHPRPIPGGKDFTFLGTIYVDWSNRPPGDWRNRFSQWVPKPDKHQKDTATIKVDHLLSREPLESGDIELEAERDVPSLPAGVAGSKALATQAPDFLSYIAPQDLRAETVAVIKRVVATPTRTPPWPLADTVGTFCTGATKSDVICLSAKRWMVGINFVQSLGVTAMLGGNLFPHALAREGEGLTEYLNYVNVFGWRAEIRQDRVIKQTENDPLIRSPRSQREGVSFHLSPYLSPNNFRFTENVVMTPFTRLDGGFGWLAHEKGHFVGGWGVGIDADFWGREIILERTWIVHQGGFAGQWVTTLGFMHPFRR